ncbi:hypothetical protein [Enterovibrio norvegicus]|uniref:hypothetical protein n=1 Tax=Enterovibrio norvegicus TaxID=188144 RepID=UPI0024B17632|nr:hypothetical protein [Enterovibrio norvegicus]
MVSRAINEVLFIIAPFIVLFIIRLADDSIEQLIYMSDPAIASCIMWGQLAARFEALKGHKDENSDNFNLFTNTLRLISLLSVILYAVLVMKPLGIGWQWFKNLFFLFTLASFVFLSHMSFRLESEINTNE